MCAVCAVQRNNQKCQMPLMQQMGKSAPVSFLHSFTVGDPGEGRQAGKAHYDKIRKEQEMEEKMSESVVTCFVVSPRKHKVREMRIVVSVSAVS